MINKNKIEDYKNRKPIVIGEIKEFVSVPSRVSSSNVSGDGVISIINTTKNGKRLILSKLLEQELELEEKVSFAICENDLLIGKTIPGINTAYPLKANTGRKVIYCSDLIKEITTTMKLDFSNVTTITLTDFSIEEIDGVNIARIYKQQTEA